MITEDYVSFETAKLLKEKGFNPLECKMYYSITTGKRTTELLTSLIACPTLQMAMKWLREVHNLHCDIGYDDLGWFWDIISVDDMVPVEDRPKMLNNGFAGSSSYEEACEKAIKDCLENLI